ncbi:hypothetical protein DB347_16665 [Opitutaceae bacterium EW11]|nr:hypothetical protein DB347_16665 [Opitutaceae bacterium EW11]
MTGRNSAPQEPRKPIPLQIVNTTRSTDALDEEPVFPEIENGRRRRLDFLGYAPCPVRNELRQRLHRRFLALAAANGAPPVWFMPAGCHEPNPYDELWRTEDAAELPALIAETGFGGFNQPSFVRRWLDSETFAAVPDDAVRPEFADAGLLDSRRQHRVIAANVEIVLADLNRLGARPLPRTWADILHARFQGDIIVSGGPGNIHESILFSLYRDHGEDGLSALGANVREFMHPAEMAKTAGSASPRGAALYVLPWFFARAAPHRPATRVVWPEEGAYLTPQYLLQRGGENRGAALAAEYLCGSEWAEHLARIGFAPARAGSPALPGRLRWVGWDFVRTQDLDALRGRLNAAFARGHRPGQ